MDNQIKMRISLKQNKINIGSPSVVVNTGGGGVEPTGIIDITENGEYNVKYYAGANVNVPIPEGYIVPEGTFSAAKVGTYNVTEYAEAEFSVETETKEFTPTEEEQVYQPDEDVYITSVKVNPIPEQYIVPEGRIEVNKVGDYDVTSYAEASFSVEVESKEFTPTEVTQEYTPPVDVYISSVKVNPIPEQYIVPSGNIDIVDTNSVDVTSYASAQIKDENLKPENIAEGQVILGIEGTFRGGIDTSDGTITADKVLKDEIGYAKEEKIVGTIETYDYSTSEEVRPDFDKFIMGELTEYYNDRVTVVSASIFEKNTVITSVNMPNLITTQANSFGDCTNLIKINFPKLETIGTTCFEACEKLTKAEFPNVKQLGSSCFNGCGITYLSFPSMTKLDGRALNGAKVKTLHIPNVQSIGDYGFYHAHELTKIIIEQTDSVANLATATNAFRYAYHFTGEVNATYNPEGLKDGYIYVPDILLEEYKTATNWSTFADRFKPLSEYVEEVE